MDDEQVRQAILDAIGAFARRLGDSPGGSDEYGAQIHHLAEAWQIVRVPNRGGLRFSPPGPGEPG